MIVVTITNSMFTVEVPAIKDWAHKRSGLVDDSTVEIFSLEYAAIDAYAKQDGSACV